jgi:hypothetical protein
MAEQKSLNQRMKEKEERRQKAELSWQNKRFDEFFVDLDNAVSDDGVHPPYEVDLKSDGDENDIQALTLRIETCLSKQGLRYSYRPETYVSRQGVRVKVLRFLIRPSL